MKTQLKETTMGIDRRRGSSLARCDKCQIQELIDEGRPFYLRGMRIEGEKRVCFFPIISITHDVERWYKLKLRGVDGTRHTFSAPAHRIFHVLPDDVPLIDAKYRRHHKKKVRQKCVEAVRSKSMLVIERIEATGNKYNECQIDELTRQVLDITQLLVVYPELTLDDLSKEYRCLRRDMNSEFTPAW